MNKLQNFIDSTSVEYVHHKSKGSSVACCVALSQLTLIVTTTLGFIFTINFATASSPRLFPNVIVCATLTGLSGSASVVTFCFILRIWDSVSHLKAKIQSDIDELTSASTQSWDDYLICLEKHKLIKAANQKEDETNKTYYKKPLSGSVLNVVMNDNSYSIKSTIIFTQDMICEHLANLKIEKKKRQEDCRNSLECYKKKYTRSGKSTLVYY